MHKQNIKIHSQINTLLFLVLTLLSSFSKATINSSATNQTEDKKIVKCEIKIHKGHSKVLTYVGENEEFKIATHEALENCYNDFAKNSAANKGICRVQLSCSTNNQPSHRVYKSMSCKTRSNGKTYAALDILQNNVKKMTIQKCKSGVNSEDGECHANLECHHKRVGPVIAECVTNTDKISVKSVDIYLDASKTSALKTCETNDEAQAELCNQNLKCELFDNVRGVEYKSTVILNK